MAYTRITDLVTSTEGSAFITVNGTFLSCRK